MNLYEAIYARLQAPTAATYTAISNRLYPDYIPDDAPLPAVMMERMPGDKFDRLTTGEIASVTTTYQLTIYTAEGEKAQAISITEAVTQDIDRYRAALPGLTVYNCLITDEGGDDFDGTKRRHSKKIKLEVLYKNKNN